MASTKRKVKSTAKHAQSHATRSAYKPSAQHRSTKQTAAQLYQLPFNAEEVSQVTQKAAANATEMWRSMWDSKNNQWGQLFANAPKIPAMPQMPAFDGGNVSEQFQQFSRESSTQFNRSAASAAQWLNEAYELSRENTEVLAESGNQAVALTKELSAELISYANRAFAQNVELSKEIMSCRTLNDMFDLAGRLLKTNLDNFFSTNVHLSERLFEATTEITEPLNERFTESSERLSKVLSA